MGCVGGIRITAYRSARQDARDELIGRPSGPPCGRRATTRPFGINRKRMPGGETWTWIEVLLSGRAEHGRLPVLGGSGRAGWLLAGLAPGAVVAGYRLEARIGAGGMAVVFRAMDERLGRTVAMKVLAPALAGDGQFRE